MFNLQPEQLNLGVNLKTESCHFILDYFGLTKQMYTDYMCVLSTIYVQYLLHLYGLLFKAK